MLHCTTRLFRAHNVTYWLDDEALLGQRRKKGFLPAAVDAAERTDDSTRR
jgi:phosphorylcholine metabolism protein LicD